GGPERSPCADHDNPRELACGHEATRVHAPCAYRAKGKGRVACTFRLTAPCVGERYQVVVHVDAPALADPDQPGQAILADGTHVSAETSRRLACDASRVVMRHGCDGRGVEVAARTTTIPSALRRRAHHPEP